MFERFTDRARRSVVLAQEEARLLNHDYIGTEHLLLGLIHENEGIAAKALTARGLNLDDARIAVEHRVGVGTAAPKGHIPFTPRAKKVLELSLRQALQLGHNYIGTEHVLLGLLREAEGVAAQILMAKVEGGLEQVEAEVLNLLSGAGISVQPIRESLRAQVGRVVPSFTEDEVVKRLEAIEARLSAIERLLRDQRGETEVS